MQLLYKLWTRLRAVVRRSRVEQEIDEELRAHIALRSEANMAAGMSPEEALRDARVRFGGMEAIKEACRDVRGGGIFDVLIQDLRFAARMFRKYPGLSIVSVIGMSVAIAVAAGYFAVFGAFLDATLPLSEGERVIAIQNSDIQQGGGSRQTLLDFVAWRDELKTVRDVAAFATARRNLVLPERAVEHIEVVQMTASGFRVARTAPFLGRLLVDDDEREGAPPVMVIGYEEWQRVFGGDPAVLGQSVRVGGETYTVVGVMPPGFRFPINHHYWVPLSLRMADIQSGGGQSFFIFGRLADGTTLNGAQTELAVVGARMASTYPQTHEHLRPRVVPYTYPMLLNNPEAVMHLRTLQFAIGLLLVLVAANIAILVYARIATRTGELAVRTALGASRRRLIMQLFVEAFVLSGTAAIIGLMLAWTGLNALQAHLAQDPDVQLPFWVHLNLSPGVILYVAGLALIAGLIVGVVPALKATSGRVQIGLQQLSMRGSQQQLGRTWTALIIVQVAIAVAVLPFAIYTAGKSTLRGITEPAYPADEILRASLSLERESTPSSPDAPAPAQALFGERAAELLRRLEAEQGISGVTFANHFPGSEPLERVEVEGAVPLKGSGSVRLSQIAPNLFTVFNVPIVAGRAFVDADARASRAVIVDQLFLKQFLGGASALGRRVRIMKKTSGTRPGDIEPGPWLEIVGVVPAFAAASDFDTSYARLYQPIAVDQISMVTPNYPYLHSSIGVQLAVRVARGSMPAFTRRLSDIAAAVDPSLQLDELQSAADVERQARSAALFTAIAVTAVTSSVLLLTATGIYAMMSFTVTKRRREIGIRVALGADARRLLTGVFARASAQLSAGVLCGLVLATVVDRAAGGGPLTEKGTLLIPAVAMIMISVGLLAALGPARRGLAVQPIEVLREE